MAEMTQLLDERLIEGCRRTVINILANTVPKQINDVFIEYDIDKHVNTSLGMPTIKICLTVKDATNGICNKHMFSMNIWIPDYGYDTEDIRTHFAKQIQNKIDSLTMKIVKAVISGDYSHVCDENNPFGF